MLQALTMLFFSPTGNTLRAARLLAQGLAEKITEIDLSLPQGEAMHFGENDTVLIAGPVFGGRMPAYFLERLARFTGNHTKAITAAVYGNRAYEDALLELNDAAQRQGFQVVASAALLAEHSMVRTVAAGRPDQEDQKQISKFAQAIIKKYDCFFACFFYNEERRKPAPYSCTEGEPHEEGNVKSKKEASGCSDCRVCAAFCTGGCGRAVYQQ